MRRNHYESLLAAVDARRASRGEAWIRYGVRAGCGTCALLALAQVLPLRSASEGDEGFSAGALYTCAFLALSASGAIASVVGCLLSMKLTSRVVLGLLLSLAPWIFAALYFGGLAD